MSYVIPALKARMGETTYYEATMTARALASVARPASEADDWAGLSIEERLQRDINEKRIDEQIVPYLAEAKDRFFGSVIVLVKGDIIFEDVGRLGAKIPAAYRSEGDKIGFLTIEDDSDMVILDGQHRVVALRKITQGQAQGENVSDVPNDEICVLFIPYEDNPQRARRIFNKVNRNAKPTSRSDNIITSEDDGYAIISRWLLDVDRGGPLSVTYEVKDRKAPGGKRDEFVVNWKTNTIPARSLQITTISGVYQSVKDILDYEGFRDFDEKHRINRPDEEELEAAFEHVKQWWEEVIHGITAYRQALEDPRRVPDLREPEQPYSLLFKPIGQIVLFKGLERAMERGNGNGNHLELAEAVSRANRIDWSIKSDLWLEILVRQTGAVTANKQAYDLGADLVAYLIAPEYTSDAQREQLWRDYNFAKKGIDVSKDEVLNDPEVAPLELPTPPIVRA